MKAKAKKIKKQHKPLTKKQKIIIVVVVTIILTAIVATILWLFVFRKDEIIGGESWGEEIEYIEPIYSSLTGLEIADASLNSSPTYCVQIPNGSTDGARPQAGLNAAAVVFEAIAEAGITRFAAVFQNAEINAIGPIRSLRPYYLDWDTPFDCTVVHAGGSDEAMAALRSGGQRDLNENYTYMWRETGTGRNWNNLFTSPELLNQYNISQGWDISLPKTFARFTPPEVSELQDLRAKCQTQVTETKNDENDENDENDDEEPALDCPTYTPATSIKINFSTNYSHNALYTYDPATNTYLRSHQDGNPHLTYNCPPGLVKPSTKTACGEPVQVAPSVVIAMRVLERNMADNYHQQITTIGSGEATIFQNGEVIPATWSKASQAEQIVFKDANGEIIKLAPGQLWISAVPQYGSVNYQ